MNAKEIADAYDKWNHADCELYEWFLEDVLELEVDDWDDDLKINIDTQDWDGISIELINADKDITFTYEQISKVEEKGFNVICVHVASECGTSRRWLVDSIVKEREFKV